MAYYPSDDYLETKIQELIRKVDMETMGFKSFLKLLEKESGGVSLKPKKAFIKERLTEAISKLHNADDDSDQEEEEESEDEEVTPSKKKSRKGGGGLAAKKEISDKLANFLGKGKEMARTEIVKSLWDYIRENDLQNPANRREIFLDEAMKEVFGCKSFTMFTMNKYIGAHVHPFKPVDLTINSTPKKRKAPKSAGEKKKRKTGTQPPFRLSDAMVAVVGKSVLPRPQVVKKLWEYIKGNDLQNPTDKREILCDEKLFAIMKTKKVSMFKMNQLITPHLLEKVDKADYQHSGSEDEGGSDSE